jgi:hypothetical protein
MLLSAATVDCRHRHTSSPRRAVVYNAALLSASGLDDDDTTTMDGCLNAAIKQDIIGVIDKPQTNMA